MTEPNQSNYTVWVIVGIISIVIGATALIGYFIYPSTKRAEKTNSPELAQIVPPKSASAPSSSPTALQPDQISLAPASNSEPVFQALVEEQLLNKPVPEDSALAKEELFQLADVQKQLQEQKVLLEQQNQSAEELIRLKEQQIADLEQQLQSS